jgi:glycosyltransferase involved in cell wall biosynthesis
MKILFFVRDLGIGGTQRQLALLAAGLARRGHDVAVAVLYGGGALEALLGKSGARLLAIGKSSRWQAVVPLARLRRVFQKERPEVVYAFLPTQTTLAALLLSRRLKTKLVFGIRAAGVRLDHYDALTALMYRCEAWLSRRADLVIVNARAACADAVARGFPRGRIVVVSNGIDTDAMQPDAAAGLALRRMWGLANNAFVVGCVARLDPMKNHATLLKAAAAFARHHSDARLVCIGEGSSAYRAELEALANSLGLADRVIWAGDIRDVKAAYNSFDITTLSSSFGEGFPNAVAEAMACGIPVVATDVGDVRSIIGTLGEVVPPDDPDLLCAGWTRLRSRLEQNPGLRGDVRSAIMANHGLDLMVRRSETILAQLIADRLIADIGSDLGEPA